MASYTTNLNLKKPTTSEMYNVLDWNDNSDKIDTFAGGVNNKTYTLTGSYSCVVIMGNYVSGYGCTSFVPFMRSDNVTTITINSATVYGTSGDKKEYFTVGSKYKMGFVLTCSEDYAGKAVTLNFTAT